MTRNNPVVSKIIFAGNRIPAPGQLSPSRFASITRCQQHQGESLRFFLGFALLYLSLAPQLMAAQSVVAEEPEGNPGRPTVSTPATLTPVGYLQFESGFTGAHNSSEFSSRYSFNEVLKLSVTGRLELLASAEPAAHFTADDATANRVADVFLGAQGVLYHGGGPKPTLA